MIQLNKKLIIIVAVVWVVVVFALGFDWPFRLPWDFSGTGVFGDSFGALSAGMATLAALFTLENLRDSQAQTEEFRKKEKDREEFEQNQRAISEARELSRDEISKLRDLELTYFRMLDQRRDILKNISDSPATGDGLMKNHYYRFASHMRNKNIGPEAAWTETLDYFQHSIDQYLRYTYHTVKFVEDRFPIDRQYEYARLLRAQLSNNEQAALAINCAHGEGALKFKRLVEKYALLHNIDESARKALELDKHFARSALESPTSDPAAHDH